MTDEDERLSIVFREGFLQQVQSTIERLGQDEGQEVVRQALMMYVARPLEMDVLPPNSPFVGLTPGQRNAVSQAAAEVLALIAAEVQRPS